MGLPETRRVPKDTILHLDRDQESCPEFRLILSRFGRLAPHHHLESLLPHLQSKPEAYALLDTATLLEEPAALLAQVTDLRLRRRIGLVTSQLLEEYLYSLRSWGLTRSIVKTPPVDADEVRQFLAMLADPLEGFGLLQHFNGTLEMYSAEVDSLDAKHEAIEQVINHFATCGFDVHRLYNVRLTLEEILNNALFHAFQSPDGMEKYSIQSIGRLQPGESVRIHYGSDAAKVGFAVTDSAGSLPTDVALSKLERQMDHSGLLDESGRGLYLARIMSSRLIINVEHGKRTQVIALFDEAKPVDRPKPFVFNYSGPDDFAEWGRPLGSD